MQMYFKFVEKISRKCLLMIKFIRKLKIVAIIQVNREVQRIVFVT